MADDVALAQLTDALQRADAEGYRRGLAQAHAELAGLDPAGLIAGAFADAMEQTASRMTQLDGSFAERLTVFAGRLRGLAVAPKVVSYDPRGGATVPTEALVVSATFDSDMDGGTVSLSVAAASGGPALHGTESYDPASRTVSFQLENPLSDGVTYRATADGASVDGAALEDAFTWEFAADDG